ncbi:hypothetical protein [Oceanobacillus locisalsi]|uniref:Uncharacterized protein n=1 Tax=Oceanobacillus locisalsi TaxID=546107 RepID=A0ABW3NJU0_9BACI
MDFSKELTDIFSVDINVKENEEQVEAYIQEIERFVPTPFTAEEKKWLEQITIDYMSLLCNQKEKREN